jgi:hypothetical protein
MTATSAAPAPPRYAAVRNVCFWHKAAIVVALGNVRFWG